MAESHKQNVDGKELSKAEKARVCRDALKHLLQDECTKSLSLVPKDSLNARERLNLKRVYDRFAQEDSEEEYGHPLKDRPATGSGRRGRPRKPRFSADSGKSSSGSKPSWVDTLSQLGDVKLPVEVQALIDATDQGDQALQFLKAEVQPLALERARELFYYLLIADFAVARGATDRSKLSDELQEAVQTKLKGLPAEWKAGIGTEIKEAIENGHDDFVEELNIALRLTSFCKRNGAASIFYLWEQFNRSFLKQITTQGTKYEKAKTALQTLGLVKKAEQSGAKELAEGIRTRLQEAWGIKEDQPRDRLALPLANMAREQSPFTAEYRYANTGLSRSTPISPARPNSTAQMREQRKADLDGPVLAGSHVTEQDLQAVQEQCHTVEDEAPLVGQSSHAGGVQAGAVGEAALEVGDKVTEEVVSSAF